MLTLLHGTVSLFCNSWVALSLPMRPNQEVRVQHVYDKPLKASQKSHLHKMPGVPLGCLRRLALKETEKLRYSRNLAWSELLTTTAAVAHETGGAQESAPYGVILNKDNRQRSLHMFSLPKHVTNKVTTVLMIQQRTELGMAPQHESYKQFHPASWHCKLQH